MHKLKRWDSIWWLLLFKVLLLLPLALPCPPPCECHGHSVTCSNLTSTAVFLAEDLEHIKTVSLTRCEFANGCVRLEDFVTMPRLHKLSITSSNLKQFPCQPTTANLPQSLRTLDLSHNWLEVLNVSSLVKLSNLDLSHNRLEELNVSTLVKLSSLDMSHNRVSSLHSQTFQSALKKLDLAENLLTDPAVLRRLPSTLKYLDISGNPWLCSPSLSWSWPLLGSGALHNISTTKCQLAGSKRTKNQSPLLMEVARVYSSRVQPQCHKGCECRLNYWADLGPPADPEYNVAVNCSGLGLTVFPKLPKHTKKLDLSNNSLSSTSYDKLDVVLDNYERVQYLNISHNNLNSFTNKFLKIMLKTEFIATHNQLTDIPYDFFKHLQKNTVKILLGNNPWICGCNAEIKMLKDKIKDLENIFCGLGSVPESINQKQLINIEEMVLCPPEDDGSLREVLLQLLCVFLAILIILVLAKLVYDFWIYRNRGKLPWIVLKMP